jgi:branched-chain amino acid transport system ATP-binding protein
MLSLNNIEVIYSNVILVLRGVSLEVPEGKIVALLGANGAGKSTTLKAISGLLHSQEGEVTRGSINGASSAAYIEKVYEYFPPLKDLRKRTSGYLSGGEQQMLVIGRGLMARPRLLLLDEPSMGLAPLLVREIFKVIRQITDEEGIPILLVEQNARVALDVADSAYVMETGRVVLNGTAEELADNEDIKEFYLGLTQVGERKSYRDVKHYRRRKRWLG